MSDVKLLCDQLDKEYTKYPNDISSLNSKIDTNMETGMNDRSLWAKFWDWVRKVVQWGIEEIAKVRDIFTKIWKKIESDVLPFVFAPFYLDSSSDKFAEIAQRTADLAGRMAPGQISPSAGWSGVGYDAYEGTWQEQAEAAKITASSIQKLSEQLHTVAVNMLLYWQKLVAGIGKFYADSLAEVANLVDVKKWTEVIPAIANIANGFYQLIIDQLVALSEYMASAVPLMDALNEETLGHESLPGGQGWPTVRPAITQPYVPGERPSWDDGDDGPNI